MTIVSWRVGNVEFTSLAEARIASENTGLPVVQKYTEYGFYDKEITDEILK